MDQDHHEDINGGHPTSSQQPDGASLAGAASPHHEVDEHEESGHEGPDDASRKRKRPPITACEVCKARKVKCDRAEPTCGWCARNGRVCVYRERQKPGFRAGYGRELEQKINRLEAMLHVLGRRVELHILEHDAQKTGHPGAQIPDIHSDAATIHMSSQSPSAGDNGRPTANGYDRTSYPRSSGPMSVQSMVNMNMMENGSHPPEPPPAFGTSLGQEQSSDLPPYDLLYAIVDLYFKHVNPWCPILDRQVTLDRVFGPRPIAEADRVLVHSIICAALRFSQDPRLTPESRQRYLDISRQKIFLYSFHNQGVPALQALMILAMDALGTSNGPQSGNLLAVIIRSILQLGLQHEKGVHLTMPSHPSIGTLQDFIIPPPNSWIEDEARRRLFWMAYILDRYESVASAKEFSLNELQTDRPLPCRYDLFSKNQPVETRRFVGPEQADVVVNRPENLGSFSYHCDVLRILSRVHLFLRNPIDISSMADVENWQHTYRQLDGELNTWLYNLPDDYSRISQLCHSSPTSRISNWIMLHAAFVIAVLRLHSCAAYPTVRSHLFAPSYNAMQRCLAAVESLREIAQDVVNTGMLDLLGPHFAFALWVSARVLLVHAAATEDDVNSNIGFFISTLEKMGYYWDVARRYAQILDRVLQEYQESKRPAAAMLPSPSTPPPKSLADMRRCAYHLSFLLSQRSTSVLQPPSIKTPGLNELEYFDIFDFFNYPRLAGPHVSEPLPPNMGTPSVDKGQFVSTNFAAPASEADWLSFRPPHD